MKHSKIMLNLMLFGEGAPAGADGGQTGDAADAGHNRADKADVVYGKPPAQAEAAAPQDADVERDGTPPENPETEFEELIKGKYKDIFNARVQSIINSRFREARETEERMKETQPLLEMMAGKYGVDASDIEALSKAVQDDDSLYEQEASERGVSVEVLKDMKRLERENAQLREAREARERQEQAQQVYGEWMQQSEQVKAIYPSFDFETEIQNPQFVNLIKAPGVDVRTAYEVLHRDEVIGGAMQHTAQAVARKMANNIAANGSRPKEGGVGSQSGVTFKSDVNSLGKQDIQEILKRVARGERIEF